MWRTTGDRKWRERGWEVFQAIELRTRTPTAYASLLNVQQVPSQRLDEMPRCVWLDRDRLVLTQNFPSVIFSQKRRLSLTAAPFDTLSDA